MTDHTGVTNWSYDNLGRVTQVGAPNGLIGYGYDAEGRRTAMTLPAGQVTYTLDAAGRVVEITDWDGLSSTYPRLFTLIGCGVGRRSAKWPS